MSLGLFAKCNHRSRGERVHGSSPAGVSSGRRIGSRAWPFPPSQARQFYLEVGLTSVRGLAANANVYVHFGHPLVTGLRLTRSHPPAVVHKLSEARLSNATVTCKVNITSETMEQVFHSEPLAVEVWHRDAMQGDQLIGVASLQLGDLLMEPTRFRCGARVFTTMAAAQTFVAELDAKAKQVASQAEVGGGGGSHSARRVTRRARDIAEKAHEILPFKTLTGHAPINVLDKQQQQQQQKVATSGSAAGGDVHDTTTASAVMRREGWLNFAVAVEDRGKSDVGNVESSVVDSGLISRRRVARLASPRHGETGGGSSTHRLLLFPDKEGKTGQLLNQVEEEDADADDNYAARDACQERVVSSAVRAAVHTVRQEYEHIVSQLRSELQRRQETQERDCEAAVEARVSELQREWTVREMARAEDMEVARSEYAELNQRLRRALADVERRERAVKQLEHELRTGMLQPWPAVECARVCVYVCVYIYGVCMYVCMYVCILC
jgi:hypothetical protein